jgi:hypothetical protein
MADDAMTCATCMSALLVDVRGGELYCPPCRHYERGECPPGITGSPVVMKLMGRFIEEIYVDDDDG